MYKKHFLFLLVSPLVMAETVEFQQDPKEFDGQRQAVKFEQEIAKKDLKLTAYLEEDNSLKGIEQHINQAILRQDWAKLERLLGDYAKQEQFDPLLLDYALAALAYAKKDYRSAAFYYQQLLKKQPDLTYPRFDLALILKEDYRYREAEQEFKQLKTDDLRNAVNSALAQIEEEESWKPDFYLQYTQTNNVNNASSSPTVNVNGRIFIKESDSLPQSAKGVRYGVGLSKMRNIGGNHFVGVDLGYNGVYYWNNHDYSEQSVSLTPKYSYRTATYRIGVSPFIEQNWLGSSRYIYQFGSSINAVKLFERGLISGSFSHLQKRYSEQHIADRYNGYRNQLTLGTQWQAVKNWRFFANLNASREITREKAQSSNKWLATIGVIYQTPSWASSVSVGYGKRYFADKHYLFGYKRQDKEYQANVAVWNRSWHWQGIVPKLNFRYQKIDSNIADFYSRSNKEVFMTLEKLF
ncbi:TPR repeat-containing protein [Mannheimia haemolytica]